MKRDSWIFTSITLALLGATLMALAKEHNWTPWGQRPLHITLVAKSAKSLKPGMEVKLSGISIGRLNTIAIAGDAHIIGKIDVDPAYAKFVGPSSVLSVDQDGIIGDSFLSIAPDLSKNKPKTKAGSTLELPLEPPVDPKELLIGLAATRMHLEATIANAGKVAAKDVPMTLSSVRQGVDSFSDLAKTLTKETVVTAPSVRDTLQDARVNLKQVGEAGLSARVTSEEIRNLIETLKKLLN